MKRNTETHHLDWNGMLLEITYDPEWLPARVAGQDLAYLEVRSIRPAQAPLPIAATGYYAHSHAPATIAAAGGPVNYVDVMLAAESLH